MKQLQLISARDQRNARNLLIYKRTFWGRDLSLRSIICLQILTFILAIISMQAMGQQADNPRGIGYSSVAAALEALKARNDVKVNVQGGWTIINDPSTNSLWSFTPPDHPAHPAAVKRSTIEKNGSVFLDMQALCQADKTACDKLITEFENLNDKIREDMHRKSEVGKSTWSPTDQQKSRATEMISRYFAAIDSQRYREAYDLYSSGFKGMVSFEKFEGMEQSFRLKSGGEPLRNEPRVTWYKDPQNAPALGVYAAFNIKCKFHSINICEEVLILHELPDGAFTLNRTERKFIEKEIEKKIREPKDKS